MKDLDVGNVQMILLTSLYHEADARRRAELQECLRRNISAEQLDEIHVPTEDAMAAEQFQISDG